MDNIKFEQRARLAILQSGVEVIEVRIIKGVYENFLGEKFNQWVLLFSFMCPCGNKVEEGIRLTEYWKSRFDRTTNYLKKHIFLHLKEEGLI